MEWGPVGRETDASRLCGSTSTATEQRFAAWVLCARPLPLTLSPWAATTAFHGTVLLAQSGTVARDLSAELEQGVGREGSRCAPSGSDRRHASRRGLLTCGRRLLEQSLNSLLLSASTAG